MRRFLLPLSLFVFATLSACSFSLAEDIKPPPGSEMQMPVDRTQPEVTSGPMYPMVPPRPANGASLYTEKCAPCHGSSGQGDGPQAAELPNPVAPLSNPEFARQAAPADWYEMVSRGNLERFMPPFTSLSDRQRWDVVAYSYMLGIPADEIAAGQDLYNDHCASCHGEKGDGNGAEIPSQSPDPIDFTDQAFMARRSAHDLYISTSDGVSPAMPAFGDQLSENERWAIASYLRSLTFSLPAETQTGVSPTAEATAESIAEGDEPAATVTNSDQTDEPTAGKGTIAGTVTNASGGELLVGLEVTLRGFDDMQEVITQTTTVTADGSFLFEEVDMPAGRVFMALVEFNEAVYGSDIGVVKPELLSLDLPIEVYETTTDDSVISVDRLHLFFEFVDENTLRVIQLYIMSNMSDKTLVASADDQPTVRFRVPEGAQNLEFQDGILGDRYLVTEDGFGDSVAVRPGAGTYEVLYAYDLPYDGSYDLSQELDYPVNAVVILMPEGNVKIKSDNLQDEGLRDVQGSQYRVYNGSMLPAGENLELEIAGKSGGGGISLSSGSASSAIIGLAAFGFALIVAGVWLYQRNRTTNGEHTEDNKPPAGVVKDAIETASAETLMDAIIALDDLYKEGELPEDAYLKRRAELKERLRKVMEV